MKKSELFDLYLLDKLNEEQLAEFKSRLNDDPDFNKEFQSIKEIRYAVRHNARLDIRGKLDRIESSINSPVQKPKQNSKRLTLLVTAMVLVLCVALFIENSQRILNSNEAFLKYYLLPNIEDVIDRPSEEFNTLASSAVLAFQSGNYQLANNEFTSLVDSVHQGDLHLLTGLSALEVGKRELAIDQFNIVINNFEQYKPTALWYAGLSYLAADKRAEAICVFYKLSLLPDHAYKTERILDRLGADINNKMSLGIIESIINENSSGEERDYSSKNQKGVISDLTTRIQYEFHLTEIREELQEGKIINYLPLTQGSEVEPVGIAFLKEAY